MLHNGCNLELLATVSCQQGLPFKRVIKRKIPLARFFDPNFTRSIAKLNQLNQLYYYQLTKHSHVRRQKLYVKIDQTLQAALAVVV